mmetsp:Transcript_7268/g.6404  ORF Transcript_7268/g.6404 Transcript_7268/m.6404 type:complete len:240 (+) Transcript_7268:1749-2468(+)
MPPPPPPPPPMTQAPPVINFLPPPIENNLPEPPVLMPNLSVPLPDTQMRNNVPSPKAKDNLDNSIVLEDILELTHNSYLSGDEDKPQVEASSFRQDKDQSVIKPQLDQSQMNQSQMTQQMPPPPPVMKPPPAPVLSFQDQILLQSQTLKKAPTAQQIKQQHQEKEIKAAANQDTPPLNRRVSHMDTLKEQIMLRKMALNPDMGKKGGDQGVNLAKNSNLISKFAAISDDEEGSEASDSD